MSQEWIRDYLRTQGLKLPVEAIQVALLTAQTILNFGQGSVDSNVIWYDKESNRLADYLPDTSSNRHRLQQIYLALDSTMAHQSFRQAVVYGVLPHHDSSFDNCLVHLVGQGYSDYCAFPITEETCPQHLAVRSAYTGWMNIIDDFLHSQQDGILLNHQRSGSAMAIPICQTSGAVLGVIYVESNDLAAFDAAVQVQWVGLALALVSPLNHLIESITDTIHV